MLLFHSVFFVPLRLCGEFPMRTFLGFGLGPIQTGIFLLDAVESGRFGRIAVSEIDAEVVSAVRSAGRVTINIASAAAVYSRSIPGIEVYDPNIAADRAALVALAAEADELATALPSVAAYPAVAELLAEAFARAPDRPRIIYAAENRNDAAERLQEAVAAWGLSPFSTLFSKKGTVPLAAVYVNTVIGKMSQVVTGDDLAGSGLAPLAPGLARAHLVESFNEILISDTRGLTRGLTQLIEKPNLLPFEEAKLFGHNAIHAAIGFLAAERGLTTMAQAGQDREIMEFAERTFLDECGAALCRKWGRERAPGRGAEGDSPLFRERHRKRGQSPEALFTAAGFTAYARDLLVRMTNPLLRDTVARVCRDLERKLGWDDRLVGTLRLCLSQGVEPVRMARVAALAAQRVAGTADPAALRSRLADLWPSPWTDEHESVWRRIEAANRSGG
jgi:mannitol-1-phosphate/altronate dehydrogenase